MTTETTPTTHDLKAAFVAFATQLIAAKQSTLTPEDLAFLLRDALEVIDPDEDAEFQTARMLGQCFDRIGGLLQIDDRARRYAGGA